MELIVQISTVVTSIVLMGAAIWASISHYNNFRYNHKKNKINVRVILEGYSVFSKNNEFNEKEDNIGFFQLIITNLGKQSLYIKDIRLWDDKKESYQPMTIKYNNRVIANNELLDIEAQFRLKSSKINMQDNKTKQLNLEVVLLFPDGYFRSSWFNFNEKSDLMNLIRTENGIYFDERANIISE